MPVMTASLHEGVRCPTIQLLLAVLSFSLCSGVSLAQGPITRSAIELAQQGELEQAEYRIVSALATEEAEQSMTWYVQAYILKERFIQEGRLPDSPLREQAIASALQCIDRDSDRALGKWYEPLLGYLGDTYLEDARMAIGSMTPEIEGPTIALFNRYVEVQSALDPDWDRQPEWVLLLQQMGEAAMFEAKEREKSGAGPWFKLGVEHYRLAALEEHDRARSMYNLAVHTYNQGVREFKAAEDNLDAIDAALNAAAAHWQHAADLLEQTISFDDRNSVAYEALAIVSKALLNQDRLEWCKAHLKELGGG